MQSIAQSCTMRNPNCNCTRIRKHWVDTLKQLPECLSGPCWSECSLLRQNQLKHIFPGPAQSPLAWKVGHLYSLHWDCVFHRWWGSSLSWLHTLEFKGKFCQDYKKSRGSPDGHYCEGQGWWVSTFSFLLGYGTWDLSDSVPWEGKPFFEQPLNCDRRDHSHLEQEDAFMKKNFPRQELSGASLLLIFSAFHEPVWSLKKKKTWSPLP